MAQDNGSAVSKVLQHQPNMHLASRAHRSTCVSAHVCALNCAPPGEARAPAAVAMGYTVLRSFGSGTGSGRGAKSGPPGSVGVGSVMHTNLTRPSLHPSLFWTWGCMDARRAQSASAAVSSLSALGVWPSSAFNALVPSSRGARWVHHNHHNHHNQGSNTCGSVAT